MYCCFAGQIWMPNTKFCSSNPLFLPLVDHWSCSMKSHGVHLDSVHALRIWIPSRSWLFCLMADLIKSYLVSLNVTLEITCGLCLGSPICHQHECIFKVSLQTWFHPDSKFKHRNSTSSLTHPCWLKHHQDKKIFLCGKYENQIQFKAGTLNRKGAAWQEQTRVNESGYFGC